MIVAKSAGGENRRAMERCGGGDCGSRTRRSSRQRSRGRPTQERAVVCAVVGRILRLSISRTVVATSGGGGGRVFPFLSDLFARPERRFLAQGATQRYRSIDRTVCESRPGVLGGRRRGDQHLW